MGERVHNVMDRRHAWMGSWEVEALVYDELTEAHVGRTVIYRSHSKAEAGTISSWRDGLVWVRFGTGDTAAACAPGSLTLAVRPLDGDLNR